MTESAGYNFNQLLQIQITPPQLSEEERELEARKVSLKKLIGEAGERLESIRLLLGNERPLDALLLMRTLILDQLVIASGLSGGELKSESRSSGVIKDILNRLPDEVSSIFYSQPVLLELDNPDTLTLEKAQEMADSFELVQQKLQKRFKKLRQDELSTPLTRYRWRLKWQGIALALLISIPLLSFIAYKNKHPVLKSEDTAEFFWLGDKEEPLAEEKHLSIPVVIDSSWKSYRFEFSTPIEGVKFRFDPVNQKHAKVQIKYIRFLGKNGEILWERPFQIEASGIIRNHLEVGPSGMRLGNLKPGGFVEVVTETQDPYMFLVKKDHSSIEGIHSVEFEMRVTEKWKKFP